MAISGQGFFPVSEVTATNAASSSTPTFSPQQYYSRAGDFSLNKSGYIVNSAGQYLNGWQVNSSTGAIDRNQLAPIQINQSVFDPVATSQVTLSANLPATPAANTPISSQVNVYDSLGTAHTVTLNWTQVTNATGTAIPGDWNVQVNVPDDQSAPVGGGAGTIGALADRGSAKSSSGRSRAAIRFPMGQSAMSQPPPARRPGA